MFYEENALFFENVRYYGARGVSVRTGDAPRPLASRRWGLRSDDSRTKAQRDGGARFTALHFAHVVRRTGPSCTPGPLALTSLASRGRCGEQAFLAGFRFVYAAQR